MFRVSRQVQVQPGEAGRGTQPLLHTAQVSGWVGWLSGLCPYEMVSSQQIRSIQPLSL